MEATAFYQQSITQHQLALQEVKKSIRLYTALRLLFFLLIIFSIWLSIVVHTSALLLVCITIGVFIWLMGKQSKADYKRSFLQHLIAIDQSEIEEANGSVFSSFNGNSYKQASHLYSTDLDIFGEGSLFQQVNRTTTQSGETHLVNLLRQPLQHTLAIKEQQKAIEELSSLSSFRQQFQAHGRMNEQEKTHYPTVLNWLKEAPVFITKTYLPYLLWLVPALAVASIIWSGIAGEIKSLVLLVLLTNWILLGFFLKKVHKLHAQIGKNKDLLSTYAALSELVMQQSFQSSVLAKLKTENEGAVIALKQLSQLANLFDQRLNTMLGPVFNSLFLFDLQCVYRIEKWKQTHQHNMLHWMESIGELDMLISLGNYAANHPQYTYPEVYEATKPEVKVTNMGHPLIPTNVSVPNSLQVDQHNQVFIITGSNMSGKSTFLRALGLNVMMSMIGLPVCAKHMQVSIMRIMSSMRVDDSLQDHTSYFYAELKRLKLIMDTLKDGVPSLLLIDEMLKGTNSKEKLEGSITVIENLIHKPCAAFIATHDLALGVLEQKFPKQVLNFSFESEIINDELAFDYKLKEGVASSTNATFLLHKMGIVST